MDELNERFANKIVSTVPGPRVPLWPDDLNTWKMSGMCENDNPFSRRGLVVRFRSSRAGGRRFKYGLHPRTRFGLVAIEI